MPSNQSTPITGTREWSVESVNVVLGCPHRCRYCYAAARAVKFRQCPGREAWGTTYHSLRPAEVRKQRRQAAGRVMFPTTHDLTPEFLGPCMEVIENLLRAGNELLIVSKPHIECIRAICGRFLMYRDAILFRFSIGATDDKILGYWEPGAPTFGERLASLVFAFESGYATSVSAEPLLDADHVLRLVNCLSPYVTDTIWIGKMNEVRRRCSPDTSEAAIAAIEAGQTDAAVARVYDQLKDRPYVRLKESYAAVLGLSQTIEGRLSKEAVA
jgi:hypothetical protein